MMGFFWWTCKIVTGRHKQWATDGAFARNNGCDVGKEVSELCGVNRCTENVLIKTSRH